MYTILRFLHQLFKIKLKVVRLQNKVVEFYCIKKKILFAFIWMHLQ